MPPHATPPAAETINAVKTRDRPARTGLRLLTGLALAFAGSVSLATSTGAAGATRCVYVSSYDAEYGWSSRIEDGLRRTLASHCHLTSLYMDTKRERGADEQKAAAAEAISAIRELDPAIVITSDDNAARQLIVPYLKDGELPVVFTGINWTVEEYGFPWPNVTGMVEVAPIRAMLEQAIEIVARPRRLAYIAANTPSEWKNVARMRREARALGITVIALLVENMTQYESSFLSAQGTDILILGGNAGIRGWDEERARALSFRHTGTLSLTTRDWMMPYAMLGLTKVPEEHGEWAGESAIAILEGRSPSTIPLATNRRWESWVNEELLQRGGFKAPISMQRHARRVASTR